MIATTTRSPERTTARRSLLTRTAAAAIGVLSFASLTLIGTGTSASAATGATGSSTVTTADREVGALQASSICLTVEGVGGAEDRDCGRSVTVRVPGTIQAVGISARRHAVCVALRGVGGAYDRQCDRFGRLAEARVPGIVGTISLFVEDSRLCGRASRTDGTWTRYMCNRRGGWLTFRSGGSGFDALQVRTGWR